MMDPARFEKIKEGMSSSMKMMMDHIKRYLDLGKASAFVGAGFSKNALIPDTIEIKDWNRLGLEFYKRLYGHVPEGRDSMFLSPIHLASQVESSFGRNELDTLIYQSLPDDAIIPGRLHKGLLKLKWRDVFTTNYDRLLERAFLDAGRPYSVVTNKSTLLYSKSPRIIKLHGSFPDIRPFIITEEDFRTYPDRYPEFVNTVRQSLIEQLFCLIGFSGDDPNFKSWLGWLRDVMGDQIAPVYMVTYDRKLHNAQRKLCATQKIDILNLADLPGVQGFQEGYEFFFKYLGEAHSTLWNGGIRSMLGSIESKEDLESISDEMRQVRISYPGWLTLPLEYYKYFDDVSYNIVSLRWDKIKDLTWSVKIAFLYEINWRQSISNTPFGLDWFVNSLVSLPYSSEEYNDEDPAMVLELKLTLLTYYRKKGNYVAYDMLVKELEERMASFLPTQLRKFYYDRCLKASACLEYEQLFKLLKAWDVPFTDYVGVLWKSSLLAEIGNNSAAIGMLNEALQHIRKTILTMSEDSYFLQSCWTAIRKALRFYTLEPIDQTEELRFNAHQTMLHFQRRLLENKKNSGRTREHSFHVGRTSSFWHLSGGGYVHDYLWSYRYFSLCEALGQSHGTTISHIDIELNSFFLNRLFPYNEPYAIGIMVRSNTKDYVKDCINRKNISQMSDEMADMIFRKYLPFTQLPLTEKNESLRQRVLHVLTPMLSRLCTKASLPNLLSLLEVHKEIYLNATHFLDRDSIKIIYENLPLEEYTKVQLDNLSLPYILDNSHNEDFPQIGNYLNQLQISEEAANRIIEGLSSDNRAIRKMAIYRANIAMMANCSEEIKSKLLEAVVNWRNSTKDGYRLRNSFEYAPEQKDMDRHKRVDLLREDLEKLDALDVQNIHSSQILTTMESLLSYFSLFSDLITEKHHSMIVSKFAELVLNNEHLLEREDEDEVFGGFYTYLSNVAHEMESYLYKTQHLSLPTAVVKQLRESIFKLKEKNHKYLSLEILLQKYDKSLKEADIKKEIEEKIAVRSYYFDAVQALIFLSKRNKKFQSIIQRVIHFSMFSNSIMVHDWLHYLMLFVKNDMLLPASHNELIKMLKHIYEHLEETTDDVELINDIFTNTAKVAGAVAQKWGSKPETDIWKNIGASDKLIFNEVRHAYTYGYELTINN